MKNIIKILKKRWYIVVIVVIGIIYFSYQRKIAQVKNESTYKVKRETLKDTLSLSGSIDADEHVTLRFQSSGRLTWIGVKEGDLVKKFQILATLDQRELQQNLKKYLNTFVQERNTFDSTAENENIKNTGGLSEDARRQALRTLANAQYDLNNAVIDVELKNLAIEYSNLFTPIEGIVVRVGTPYAGVNIAPTQAEIEIINPKTIYLSATADQTDVIKLAKDMKGEVSLDSYPDSSITGRISTISFVPKSGETGTVYEVKVLLDEPNDNYKYRYGMTGDVNFITNEKKNVIAIPDSAIKEENSKKYVFKSVNGNKVKTYLTLGEEIDSSTEVISGLNVGDIIYD